MANFFGSVFTALTGTSGIFLMVAVALVTGVLTAFLMSLRLESSKGFFLTCALLPSVVAVVVALVNGFIGTGVGIAIAGAFSLVRFRSAQGKAEEIILLFLSVALGFCFGAGYLAYGAIFGILIAAIYDLLSFLPIFEGRKKQLLLTILIPEDLEYQNLFVDVFSQYLQSYELVKVKMTAMGSLYKLTYKIKMKDPLQEKKMIDALRVKNGNLEISLSPYLGESNL